MYAARVDPPESNAAKEEGRARSLSFVSRLRTAALLSWLPLLAAAPVSAQTRTAASPTDLTELTIEDLLKIEVTSVSKRAEPMQAAPAAIYVVTGEEIGRSGARSVAEALRLVPGLQVARTNANTYRISARGFDSGGDKMQVLVDGRSVYTPLTSSVFWDVLDTFLPDIDRIEVIRGPGATLWGANAFNGVINIITRSSADTHGGKVLAAVGNEEQAGGALRVGTAVGDAGHVRFYAKAFERDDSELATGDDNRDGQRHLQGGLRADWSLELAHTLMVSGDIYDGSERATGAVLRGPIRTELTGANFNAHWNWSASAGNNVSAELSFDRYRRETPETFSERRRTWDFGVQQNLYLGARSDLTWGLGYRNTHDDTGGPPFAIIFSPGARTLETWNVFVEHQLDFAGDRAVWAAGSKFEHNDVTGFEVQPGTRIGWKISPSWFTWASVSHAVRTPNRLDHDIAIFCQPPLDAVIGCTPGGRVPIGSRDFTSEKLIAYEAGLRYSDNRIWSADLAAFYNDYSDLRSTERSGPGPVDFKFENKLRGHGLGGEAAFTVRPSQRLDLRGWYAFLNLQIERSAGSNDVASGANIEGSTARHHAGLRATWQPAHGWNLASALRYVGRLPRTGTPSATSGRTDVPGYVELDLRAAWRVWSALQLALVGQNLLHAAHPEFGPAASRGELERSLILEIGWEWK
jgi:iron complex outermembrane recepter protein